MAYPVRMSKESWPGPKNFWVWNQKDGLRNPVLIHLYIYILFISFFKDLYTVYRIYVYRLLNSYIFSGFFNFRTIFISIRICSEILVTSSTTNKATYSFKNDIPSCCCFTWFPNMNLQGSANALRPGVVAPPFRASSPTGPPGSPPVPLGAMKAMPAPGILRHGGPGSLPAFQAVAGSYVARPQATMTQATQGTAQATQAAPIPPDPSQAPAVSTGVSQAAPAAPPAAPAPAPPAAQTPAPAPAPAMQLGPSHVAQAMPLQAAPRVGALPQEPQAVQLAPALPSLQGLSTQEMPSASQPSAPPRAFYAAPAEISPQPSSTLSQPALCGSPVFLNDKSC